MLPLPYFLVGIMFSGMQASPLFQQNITRVIVSQHFNFAFTSVQSMSLNLKVFIPEDIFKLYVGFLCCFWNSCQYRTCFGVRKASTSIFTECLTFVRRMTQSLGGANYFSWYYRWFPHNAKAVFGDITLKCILIFLNTWLQTTTALLCQ